jgi:hypothetical protein
VRAYLALQRFVRTFKDPHLRLRRRQSTPALGSSDLAGCAAAGYAEGDHGFRLSTDDAPVQLAAWLTRLDDLVPRPG